MGYEIHLSIPEESRRGQIIAALSVERHLTPNQTVESIIDQVDVQESSSARPAGTRSIPGLPSEPLNEADSTVVDEAMALIMASRQERSERAFGA